jgi:hypothetical protein
MDPVMAATLARGLSFVVFGLMAFWYVVPWLRARGRADALVALLWVHAFRHVALHLVSTQRAGLPISDQGRDGIMYGDVLAVILAVTAIAALRYRSRLAIPLVWVFVAETAADFVSIFGIVAREHLLRFTNGMPWLISSFYVPLVMLSFALIVWQLLARWGEPLTLSTRMEERPRRAGRYDTAEADLIGAPSAKSLRGD